MGPKKICKVPAKFPARLPCNESKKFTAELLQARREKKHGWDGHVVSKLRHNPLKQQMTDQKGQDQRVAWTGMVQTRVGRSERGVSQWNPKSMPNPGSSKWRFAALRFVHSQDITWKSEAQMFKTRLKCTCKEIALSVARQTRTWNCLANMTGRPGCRTMEMNGGSSAPYLARTWKQKGFLDYQGGGRGIISIVRWNLRPVIFGVDKGRLQGYGHNPFCSHSRVS